MARAFLFVLDSFGVGGAPDAAAYGDEGADTLGHIAEFCAAGAGDRAGLREGPLSLPNMSELGLMHIARSASGRFPAGMPVPEKVYGIYGAATEISRGKDTPSGHWEIAGTPVSFDWGYFPTEGDAFPP
ncbi:phosphopentomutase, partial [Rhizobium ruizarguesonis]